MAQKRDSRGRFTGSPHRQREQQRRRRSSGGRSIGDFGSRVTTLGAVGGGGDLGAAANIIADRARGLASGWSEQIPGAIGVEVSGKVATISCQVGPAYPNEVAGVRHPTFGHDPWVTNEHRPFLGPAADQASGKAMARYAKKIDGWARKAGFE
jgi:hypothetical protein